jgi:hypothetical protein
VQVGCPKSANSGRITAKSRGNICCFIVMLTSTPTRSLGDAKKESPAVGRAHNQCLSRTSSYQSIESYCPLISQVVLCGMSIEV